MSLIYFVASALVLYKALSAISRLDPRDFNGCRGGLIGIALFWALAAPGAIAVALNATHFGGPMLLIAMAVLILTDRRKT